MQIKNLMHQYFSRDIDRIEDSEIKNDIILFLDDSLDWLIRAETSGESPVDIAKYVRNRVWDRTYTFRNKVFEYDEIAEKMGFEKLDVHVRGVLDDFERNFADLVIDIRADRVRSAPN